MHKNIEVKIKDSEFRLSRTLSWLLRHGAEQEGLPIQPDGFVPVKEILKHPQFKNKITMDELNNVVLLNNKKRFTLRTNNSTGELELKANQGHSMVSVNKIDFVPVTWTNTEHCVGTCVVHGTFKKAWPSIAKIGLSRMSRNHIHFCAYEPGDSRIISGIRDNAEIYIYIDIERALQDGIKFYKSENDVILTSGNSNGFLEPKYFMKVVDARTGQDIPFPN
uniref:2'-phosphotransferase n=2 Tax=Clastoptera arizonana TaxID=38151 RepID=A0A1B6DFR1_9HEMI